MAITNIAIAPAYSGSLSSQSSWYYGVKIRDGSTPSALYVTWKTDKYKPDGTNNAHTQFIVQARWRGIKKGADSNYGAWPTTFKTTTLSDLTSNGCFVKTDGDGAIWKVSLASILNGTFRNNSSWAFSDRIYDEFEVEVTIKAKLNSTVYGWDDEYSPIASQNLWVGYFPNYVITGVALSGTSSIVIAYTASGWTRTDDRYEIMSFTNSSGSSLMNKLWSNSSNSIGTKGYIEISTDALIRPLTTGEQVSITVRWNAAYKPAGLTISSASYTGNVGGASAAETLTYEVTHTSDGQTEVIVNNTSYEDVMVSIQGDHWSFDDIVEDSSAGEATAFLNYPPLGVNYTISVRGKGSAYDSEGNPYDTYSPVSSTTDYIDPDSCYWIDPINPKTGNSNGLPTFKLMGNKSWDVTSSQECEIRKFSGRSAPSALYGYGKTRTISLSGDIGPRTVKHESTIADLYSLLNAQICVLRNDKGERYIVALTDIAYSTSYDTLLTHVTINANEVVL